MSDHADDFGIDEGDVAPGVMDAPIPGVWDRVQGYCIGLGFATLLTVASFYVAGSTGFIWGPAIPVALVVLAIAQIGIHLVFFIHITTAPDNTNNVLALAFGVLIVVLVVAGSVWIMSHLNDNLMPMRNGMGM